jgi:peptidoglycan hydrolase CwlO-like protein
LLIYGKKGEKQQLQQWIDLADRQLVALEKQRSELEAAMDDLKALRATAAAEIAKG